MMGPVEGQTYCLRWNNHKSNLVEILDVLFQKECYVDCTIYVEGNEQFKAHRVVLAANSPYFQSILQDVPMDHCSILVPGVQPFEMKALIEYMYTGEVNVSETQIPRIIKIAEQLEVKGLFDMADLRNRFERYGTPAAAAATMDDPTVVPAHHHPYSKHNGNNKSASDPHNNSSPPIIPTSSTNISSAQSSTASPPYNYKMPYTNMMPGMIPSALSNSADVAERNSAAHQPWTPQNLSASSSASLSSSVPSPVAAVATQHLQNAAAAMLSSVYESGSDMNPLKRKKISSITSMLMSRDTPILRNVLAQTNAADSSQQQQVPAPAIMNEQQQQQRNDRQSMNHSNNSNDYSDKKIKYEMPQSPFTDKSYDDEPMESPQNYPSDNRLASYVPQQKPEWKRYKQYTRDDIQAAITCVRNGMSALKAARQFGVPSRTLYDKVKKMGITTGRPMHRSIKRSPSRNSSSPARFPYGISGTSSPYNTMNHPDGSPSYGQQHNPHDSYERDDEHDHQPGGGGGGGGRSSRDMPPTISQPAAALLDARFLQQALEAGGGDIAGREALHAMAFAAAAHAAVNGMSTSPGTHGTARSPSPSMLIKYMRPPAVVGSSPPNNNGERRSRSNSSNIVVMSETDERIVAEQHQHEHEHTSSMEEENGGVEDLSMSKSVRTPSPVVAAALSIPAQGGGVIVPPQTKIGINTMEDSVLNMKRELITAGDDEPS